MDDGKDEEILKAWAEKDVDGDGSPEVETGQHNNLKVIKEFVDGVKEEVCRSDPDAVKVKEDIAVGKGHNMKRDVDVTKKIKKEIQVNKLTSGGPMRSKSRKRLRSRSKSRKRLRSRSKSRKRSRSRSKSSKRPRSRSWDYRKTTRRKRNSSTRSRSRSVTKVQSRRSSSGVKSRSPKRQYIRRQDADKPQVSNVLGAFGLSSVTRQAELEDMFGKHGKLEKAILVLDRQGKPRGYAFITFQKEEDASRARKALTGSVLHGRVIRVDYSLTLRPHHPTPGSYHGRIDQSVPSPRRSSRSSKSRSPRSRSRHRRRSASTFKKSASTYRRSPSTYRRRSRTSSSPRRSRSPYRHQSRRSRSPTKRRSRSRRRSREEPQWKSGGGPSTIPKDTLVGLRNQDLAWRPRRERERLARCTEFHRQSRSRNSSRSPEENNRSRSHPKDVSVKTKISTNQKKSPSIHGRHDSKSEGQSQDLDKDPSTCVIQKESSGSRKGGCTQGTATGSSRSAARSLHQEDSIPLPDIKKEKINSQTSDLKEVCEFGNRNPTSPSTTLSTVECRKSPSLQSRKIQSSSSPHNLGSETLSTHESEVASPSSPQKSSSRENLSSPHLPGRGIHPAPVTSPWRNPSPPGSPSRQPVLGSQQESPLPQCRRRNPSRSARLSFPPASPRLPAGKPPSTPGSPPCQPALNSQQPCPIPQPDSRTPSRSQPGYYSPNHYSQALHFSPLPQGSTSPTAFSRNPSPPSPTPPTTPGNPEDNFWEA